MPHPNVTARRSAEPPPDKRAFTIAEFREAYGPGRTFTYELINSGRLRAVKIGAKTLILREDADAWLAGLPPLRDARAA